MSEIQEGDLVDIELEGKVTEIFEEDDYGGFDEERGFSVNLKNQGELRLGGIEVFVRAEQLEVQKNE